MRLLVLVAVGIAAGTAVAVILAAREQLDQPRMAASVPPPPPLPPVERPDAAPHA
jgi:hypothetical protein